jgi:N-acyl homoserine lactone hydrolase
MRVYAFHAGGEGGDMAAFDPFDPNVGTAIDIPFFFFLIDHPDGKVLFDTGAHPDFASDPRLRLGDEADNWDIRIQAGDDVVSRIATLGLAATDITHVVQSHLHYDHAGGIEFFPHAPVYIHRDELAFAFAPPVYQQGVYVRADFDVPGVRWVELDGEHDLFGDGRVIVFPTPGHSKGHQSMMVHLAGRTVILLSDAAYLVEKMRARALPAGALAWSPDAMVASWERIEALERQHDALLVATHDLKYRERTRLAPDAWYE